WFRFLCFVRVSKSELRQQPDLEGFHDLGFIVFNMIVALEMQHTVHHHMGPVGDSVFILLPRFLFNNWRANHEISGQWHRYTRWCFKWEGQNIGGFVLPAVLMVQCLAFFGADNTNRHLGWIVTLPGQFCPCLEVELIRYAFAFKDVLEVDGQLIHELLPLPSSKES